MVLSGIYMYIYINIIQHIFKNNMRKHMLMCLFMSMLYSKIKFEIDINNDELLKIIWKHMKEIKRRKGDILN
jgi:hypothetical protein